MDHINNLDYNLGWDCSGVPVIWFAMTYSLSRQVNLNPNLVSNFLVSHEIFHEVATSIAIFDVGSMRSPYLIFLIAFYLSSSA